jgi:hypothetical protein
MKSATQFNMLTIPPKIVATRKAIEAIKHIVKIAPQEAQWFHSVIRDENENTLRIGEELYIPEQVCSVTEVDTNSMMMVKFFKELMSKYGADDANKIVASMSCWCHSHHNMGVSPSGQDVKQFNTLVRQIIDQSTPSWQIMLIFNKKDEFYSRIYDPVSGNIYEGIEIVVEENAYDFSYISAAAKEKFKSPPARQVAFASGTFNNQFGALAKLPTTTASAKPKIGFCSEKDYNKKVADEILQSAVGIVKNKDAVLNLSSSKAQIAYKEIDLSFSDKEITWLYFLIKGNQNSILQYDTEELAEDYYKQNKSIITKEIINYLTSTATYNSLGNIMCKILRYDDCTDKNQLSHAIMMDEHASKLSKA